MLDRLYPKWQQGHFCHLFTLDPYLRSDTGFGTFGQMSNAIDKSQGLDFFHAFKEHSWGMLNSYTHTGILQLGRRWTGGILAPSYTDAEIIEMIRACTTCILLLVQPYLAKNGYADLSKKIVELGPHLKRPGAPE